MNRVDHWAAIRDRSISLVPPIVKENANLTIKVGRLTAKILQLEETVRLQRQQIELYNGTHGQKIPGSIAVRLLISQTAAKHGITINELLGASTTRALVRARQEAMWTLRKEGLSFCQIGRFFLRDHSTVIYSVKRHDKFLAGQAGLEPATKALTAPCSAS